jgi:Myb-like DNA-binding domain
MVTMMGGEETRKGPWTEQEDSQLVCFVRLFGERRWDFIARVSGLRVGDNNHRSYANLAICITLNRYIIPVLAS